MQLELEKPPVFGVLPVLDGSSRHSRLQLLLADLVARLLVAQPGSLEA